MWYFLADEPIVNLHNFPENWKIFRFQPWNSQFTGIIKNQTPLEYRDEIRKFSYPTTKIKNFPGWQRNITDKWEKSNKVVEFSCWHFQPWVNSHNFPKNREISPFDSKSKSFPPDFEMKSTEITFSMFRSNPKWTFSEFRVAVYNLLFFLTLIFSGKSKIFRPISKCS